MQKKESVLRVIKETVRKHGVLSAALLGVVCGAVIFALLPPLVLAQLIDLLTKKHTLWMEGILLYFGLLALTGLLESARESLLTVFGQKITHALRSSLMEKFGRLSANELNRQELSYQDLSVTSTQWKTCLPPGSSVCLPMRAKS